MSIERTTQRARCRARSRFRVTLGCVVLLLSVGCRNSAGATQPTTVALDTRVLTLMECVECYDGERDTVIDMGAAALPSLRDALLHGPSAERRLQLERALRAVRAPPRAALSETAIAHQLRSYRNLYTRRASDALAGIGGSGAKAVLCIADTASGIAPGASRRFIDSAIARIGGPCP